MVCDECGGDGVTRDACARWSEEDQKWEITNVYDDGHCDACGHEVRIIEKEIEP